MTSVEYNYALVEQQIFRTLGREVINLIWKTTNPEIVISDMLVSV